MKSIRILAILLHLLILLPLAPTAKAAETAVRYAASIHPLSAILREITEGRAEIDLLLKPGSSPHTFEPTPSDLKSIESAQAFFYVGPGIDEEWVGKLPIRTKISMLGLVPVGERLQMTDKHGHLHHSGKGEGKGTTDPHFWTDPLVVKAMVPKLVEELGRIDPAGKPIYTANAERFEQQLDQLNQKLRSILAPLNNEPLLLLHPSFNYLIHRYNLHLSGVVVKAPGREPTPKFLFKLVKQIKNEGIKALFTEPQLARQPAQVLAEAANIPVYEIDPIGGVTGRKTYSELLLYSAVALTKTLH